MNKGFAIENNIIKNLHGKRINELSSFWREELHYLFPDCNDNHILICRLVGHGCKTDIEIVLNGIVKRISVKSGTHVSVHAENLASFIPFLKELDISIPNLRMLLFYHFGDGTLNGTGQLRLSSEQLKANYCDEIQKLNKELNQKKILNAAVYRSLIKGKRDNHQEIDYLYYGDEKYGYLVSKTELEEFIVSHKCMYLASPHFGPLIYQPLHRNLKSKADPKYRFYAQLKWPSLDNDIRTIVNKRNNA